jgi:hypothetical protein
MAVLTTISQERGEAKFYDVPDNQLGQYELKKEKLADDKVAGAKPEGKMSSALLSSGDVQAYSGDICWYRYGGYIYYYYC